MKRLVSKPSLRRNRQPCTSIHFLDDDSLLNIFSFHRPFVLEEDEYGHLQLGSVADERWWYKFIQVCQRWRYLILGSAPHLQLALICTQGTPVADMLVHSPPLPLAIIHYNRHYGLTAADEEGIILALQHRNRVQRITLHMSVMSVQKLVTAMDGEFPALKVLDIWPPAQHNTPLTLPPTFRAPQLRLLWLAHCTSPIGSPFLTSAVGLVTLILGWIHPSTYPHPNRLLQSLSLLPQLERLDIGFRSPVPSREIEWQQLQTPITTQITLFNLHRFHFWGISTYLEALLPHMTTPPLKVLSVHFFNQLSFPVPRLLQFMMTTERPRFRTAWLLFCHEAVLVFIYPPVGTDFLHFYVQIECKHFDWQASSVIQIFRTLHPLFVSVIDLTLDYRQHTLSSEWHNQVNRNLWRELLGSFRNVETLRVHKGLVGEVSGCLQLDGEPPSELLPELKELICPIGSADDRTFTAFIHVREVAGQPVKLIGETFPVISRTYVLETSTGMTYIEPDPEPLP